MLKTIFRRIKPQDVIENQLYEAEIAALEHEAAAEHHAALAQMYRDRVTRLNGYRTISVGTTKSS
jgi:hypothetical protein